MSHNYTQLVEYYHNFEGEKIIIYYEDLMLDLKNTLEKVCNFLKIDISLLGEFVSNVESHKEKSFSIYGQNTTNGKNVKEHSNDIPQKEIIEWDNFITNKLADLSDRYLSRYYEEKI